MLTELIVRTYKTLAEIALWVLIGIGAIVGFSVGKALGWPLLGLMIGAVGTFLILAIFLGAALLLEDIHTRVGSIEKKLIAKAAPVGGGPHADDEGGDGVSQPSPRKPTRLAGAMSASGFNASEIAAQLEARGVGAADAADQALATVFKGMETQVRSAKVMAADGYSSKEVADRLAAQGVKRADALALAQYVIFGSLPTAQGNSRPQADAAGGQPRANIQPKVAGTAPHGGAKFCRSCGQPQEAGAKFCESCGAQSGHTSPGGG